MAIVQLLPTEFGRNWSVLSPTSVTVSYDFASILWTTDLDLRKMQPVRLDIYPYCCGSPEVMYWYMELHVFIRRKNACRVTKTIDRIRSTSTVIFDVGGQYVQAIPRLAEVTDCGQDITYDTRQQKSDLRSDIDFLFGTADSIDGYPDDFLSYFDNQCLRQLRSCDSGKDPGLYAYLSGPLGLEVGDIQVYSYTCDGEPQVVQASAPVAIPVQIPYIPWDQTLPGDLVNAVANQIAQQLPRFLGVSSTALSSGVLFLTFAALLSQFKVEFYECECPEEETPCPDGFIKNAVTGQCEPWDGGRSYFPPPEDDQSLYWGVFYTTYSQTTNSPDGGVPVWQGGDPNFECNPRSDVSETSTYLGFGIPTTLIANTYESPPLTAGGGDYFHSTGFTAGVGLLSPKSRARVSYDGRWQVKNGCVNGIVPRPRAEMEAYSDVMIAGYPNTSFTTPTTILFQGRVNPLKVPPILEYPVGTGECYSVEVYAVAITNPVNGPLTGGIELVRINLNTLCLPGDRLSLLQQLESVIDAPPGVYKGWIDIQINVIGRCTC